MKAAILVESGKPLVVADIELPQRLEYGQVLVRVRCSGICGSQLGEIDAVKGPDKFLPHLLGHEGGGVVEEIGAGVRFVKKGDRVVLHWRKGRGIEAPTPRYCWGERAVNAGWVTTFNEYAVVAENRVTPIPADIDFSIAALLGCAVTTGLGVVVNDARLRIGESIAVYGAGGVGLSVVQGAALVSAWPIIALDRDPAKLAMATAFGATHVIDTAQGDSAAQVRAIAGAAGVDVAVDTTGAVALIEEAWAVTSARGRTVLVGVPRAGERVRLNTLPLHFEKRIVGSHGGAAEPAEDIPRYVNLVRQGRLRLAEMITHTFTLDQINDAVALMRAGGGGRVILLL
ncbi:MAG: zinc-binding dehydrogenase [Candidatus Methylomirabilia bacterium]